MINNIIVNKKEKENPSTMYKRFSKKFKSSGIMNITRKRKFEERKLSKLVKRNETIKKLKKKANIAKEYREGKRGIGSFR